MVSLCPGVRLLLMVVGLCFFLRGEAQAEEAEAGRAFPIASENYVIEKFRSINPKLEWDRTNFLVDLSGWYANCGSIGSRRSIDVDRKTPEGEGIAGYIDYTDGTKSDVNAVNGYLERVIDRWMLERVLNNQIKEAQRFGCSVRPGCEDQVAVSCLFSPAASGNGEPTEPGNQPVLDSPNALAFTPQQYKIAELITNNNWDRSYLLENLSGFETSCEMIGNSDWQFTKAATHGQKYGLRLFGTYGYGRNKGSTQNALVDILENFKKVTQAKHVGCSLIPDCKQEDGMYVVVSCIYQEY
jgi:hypothetical protein